MPEFEIEPDRVATGGAALGTGPDGRIVFAAGALPGDRVLVRSSREHRSRIEAEVVRVLRPGPGRREAPCPVVDQGCGGCDWQHADEATQRELRRRIVVDCLTRLAGIVEPPVELGPSLPAVGYRTTIRAAVSEGRAGYRTRRSHHVVGPEACLVAHPLAEELLVDGRFGASEEVTIRVGARTGQRLVLVSPTVDRQSLQVPDDVIVVGADDAASGMPAAYNERIEETTLRISALSFFQCRPDGAEVLVDLVRSALAGIDGPLVDAYGGVGLFGALVGEDRPVTGIESSASSVADARVNYRPEASVVKARVEQWRPEAAAAVVADPARSGLGSEAASRLAATGAEVFILVSCDPASLARDAGLLGGHGYDLERVTTVDLFGQTSHVETVSVFRRK